MARRASNFLVIAIAVGLMLTVLCGLSGCGSSKAGAMGPSQYARIQKGMTIDQVEAIAGKPARSHTKDSFKNPNIIWYYTKTEGEGLVEISFIGGKVDLISPYNASIPAPEE